MTEKHRPDDHNPEETGSGDTHDSSAHDLAENLGRSLGKLARSVRRAARSAQPEAERLAHSALDAAESALPHVRRASRQAAARASQFVRENDDDIRRATRTGAQLAANHSAPLLRPVIFAVADEITRQASNLAQTPPDAESATPAPGREDPPPSSDARPEDVKLY